MSFGELFSALIVAAALRAQGVNAQFLDARGIIRADTSFGAGKVNFPKSNEQIRKHFENQSALQVVTGFIASTENNDTITLGRGGSDYSASIIGAALKVKEVEIWTDVDGMLTADPRKVPKAFSQLGVTYEEAMELSHFGAKVIYPPTMQPALELKIPIRIKNTFNPEHVGTVVGVEAAEGKRSVTGITSIEQVALLRLEGSGMVGVAGTSMRLFSALAQAKINVILITQASSEHTICFAVRPEDAARAKSAVDTEFTLELSTGIIDACVLELERSIVSVVGEKMRSTPGIAGRVFGALGRNGVNIVAIAQGSSEINISAVVERSDEVKALNALHDEFFFPDTKRINVFLVGTGLIGNALLKQIETHSECLRDQLGHEVRLIGLLNRRKMLLKPEGLPLKELGEVLDSQGRAASLSEFVLQMQKINLPSSVFVDCTASAEVVSQYEQILRSSISIVTPNKRGQTVEYSQYLRLKQAKGKRGVYFLYETSVGAGLPVISTLNDLLRSGDEIIKIEAVLSGTLSFIFNSLTPNARFSEIVEEAQKRGYTEPDPRDDLNGLDVARKILILAREGGAKIELGDVKVESLVSKACQEAESVERFFEKLRAEDESFAKRLQAAGRNGKKLCYLAHYQDGRAAVGLQEVGPENPFYSLSGADNMISFTTRRYSERPLVVRGPGAGADVTAAGVFADIIRIAS